jgi:hypothetical protein
LDVRCLRGHREHQRRDSDDRHRSDAVEGHRATHDSLSAGAARTSMGRPPRGTAIRPSRRG